MIFHEISWDFMGLHGASWDIMGFHVISWDCFCPICFFDSFPKEIYSIQRIPGLSSPIHSCTSNLWMLNENFFLSESQGSSSPIHFLSHIFLRFQEKL